MEKAKKRLSVLIVIAMVIAMFPMTVFAAESAPTGSGNAFFANGTPVTITASEPTGGIKTTLDGFTATGTSAYISWEANGATYYVGASESVDVYGGGNGSASPVTISDTSITMTGGKVDSLFGGNLGSKDKDPANTSIVTGNTNINVSGQDAIVVNLLHGGGQFNSAVNGTATVNVVNADLTQGRLGGCYINGGVNGDGSEGTRNIDEGTITTSAVVNKAVINITDSKAYLVGGGGSGSTKTNSATVTITNSDIDTLFLTGINGELSYVMMNISDSTIGELSASNRGFVANGDVIINDSTIDTWNTGAAPGCFTSDSGRPDATGVTGQVNWYLDENTTVNEAYVTPYLINNDNGYTAQVNRTYISKAGEPLEMTVANFIYDAFNQDNTIGQYSIPENVSFSFDGVSLTIPEDVTVTNDGTLIVGKTSALTAANNSLINSKGGVAVYDGGKITGVSPDDITTYYSIYASAGEGGTISPSGEWYVIEGGSIEFTITADEGYVISDVTVNGVSKGAVENLTISDVSESSTVNASFEAEKSDVTVPGSTDQDKVQGSEQGEDTPKTGDNSNIMLWIMVAAIGAVGTGSTALYLRKK